MFTIRPLLIGDAPSAAPAPSFGGGSSSAPSTGAATSTPSTNTTAPGKVNSVDELFKGIEDKYFNNDAEPDDIYNSRPDNSKEGAPKVNMGNENLDDPKEEDSSAATSNEDDGLPLYVFKASIDGEDVEIPIENPEQLDHYLKRAAIAPKIYARNQELEKQVKGLTERAAIADEFEKMSKESPTDLLNLVIEDMDEEVLLPWLQTIASELEESQEYKQRRKEAREVAYIREQWARQQEREQQQQQQHAAMIEERNIQEITNWRSNEFNKWSAKVPQEHHKILQQMIDDQLLYASNMAAAKKDVDLTTLSGRLYQYVNSIIGSQKQISAKVGKATQAARQTATSKLQAATSKMNTGRQQQSAGGPQFKDPGELFDFLSEKAGTGELKLRG